MGKGKEVSFNVSKCFSAFVKISPCSKFKKFKTNKAILTIVIGLKNILLWNLVKSALDKEDKSVHVNFPLFNFFYLQFQYVICFLNYVLCLRIIKNVCNLLNRDVNYLIIEILNIYLFNREYLGDFEFGGNFLDTTSKTQSVKEIINIRFH